VTFMGPMIHQRDLGPYPVIAHVCYSRGQVCLLGGAAGVGMLLHSIAGNK